MDVDTSTTDRKKPLVLPPVASPDVLMDVKPQPLVTTNGAKMSSSMSPPEPKTEPAGIPPVSTSDGSGRPAQPRHAAAAAPQPAVVKLEHLPADLPLALLPSVQSQAPPAKTVQSYVAVLLDFCKRSNMDPPQFSSELTDAGQHKVWVVMGRERLELPMTFVSVDEGQERTAKKVLSRLRKQQKEKEAS